jgi:hypothetical protein
MQPQWHNNGSYIRVTQSIDLALITTNINQMKRLLQITALALLVMIGGAWQNTASAQPEYNDDYDAVAGGGDVNYQTFYDELSPHGQWIDYPEYGYVWVPNAPSGFQPYETSGHWVWTDEYEWMWVSDYSWGWAPFHYGRWFNDPYYGWMWMPGYEWSPAWVAWRDGGDYYGWAPLRPGINISIGFGSYNPPIDYWCFAPRRYISSPRIYDYCLDRGRNVTIINNTTIININNRRNNVFVNGPRRADAERYAGRINPVRFRESSRPGRTQIRNNQVSVFRPRVQRDNNRQFTPRNVGRYERNGNANGQRPNTIDRIRETGSSRNNNNNLPRRNNNEATAPGNNNRNGQRPNTIDRIRETGSSRDNGNNLPRRNNNEVTTPGNNNRDAQRPNTIDRIRETGSSRDAQRPNVFDRGNNNNTQPGNDNRNRRIERPAQPQVNPTPQDNNRNAQRPNVFDRGRGNNPATQPNRQETRNNNPFERQRQQPQAQRQPQSQPQPRQFENRGNSGGGGGNREQRGGNSNSGGGRRFGR